jgi:hypothetical protein
MLLHDPAKVLTKGDGDGWAGRARYVSLVLVVIVAALPGAAVAQDTSSDDAAPSLASSFKSLERQYAPGQIIVRYKEDVGPSTKAAVRREEKLAKKQDLGLIRAEVDKLEGALGPGGRT